MNKNDENLNELRHSLAHLLAAAVLELYPEAKNSIGPAVENGFYQDFDMPEPVSEDDLPKIEKKMRELLKSWAEFSRAEVSADEARDKFAWNPYKLEMVEELASSGKPITVYTSGGFVDLCRGGHVDDARKIDPKSFKLTKVSGAYWRGDQTKQQLQRIYGVAFETEAKLKEFLAWQEEAKKRDHRVLGEKLKLFFITPDVGAGLPLLMPRGEKIKHVLIQYMREKEESRGYQYVATPVLTQRKLYERSGHADYYLENMYATEEDDEGNQFFMKPMNCPHHHMIYEKLVGSYRDLPLRLSEHAGLYRYELSGTLTGLIRMRGPITQNDSHIYVAPEQLKEEFRAVVDMFSEVYAEVGLDDYWFRLSLPDFAKDKFVQGGDKWDHAAKLIKEVLEESGATYEVGVGEAAFYGPKLDVQARNVTGKDDTIATVQIDVLVPERMGLKYVDAEGNSVYPYIIHKSIMGAFERFMAFLLEQTAGNLPLWISPEQIRVITVNQSQDIVDFAKDICERAATLGLRVMADNSNESVGKKIRSAELMKVPYTLVIGEKELESGQVMPRIRKDMAVGDSHEAMDVERFLNSVENESRSKARKSSL